MTTLKANPDLSRQLALEGPSSSPASRALVADAGKRKP